MYLFCLIFCRKSVPDHPRSRSRFLKSVQDHPRSRSRFQKSEDPVDVGALVPRLLDSLDEDVHDVPLGVPPCPSLGRDGAPSRGGATPSSREIRSSASWLRRRQSSSRHRSVQRMLVMPACGFRARAECV